MRLAPITLAVLAALPVLTFPSGSEGARLRYGAAERIPIFGSHQKRRSRAEKEEVDFHVAGEVTRGQTFQQDIGHGLVFRLAPPSNASDAGWLIQIVPKTEPEDGPIEFSAIATPPYHVYNDRIIATAYGRSAGEAVQLKDRRFFFVQSADDEHRAEEVVNAAFYPTNLSDEERVRVASEQHEIQVSKGELHILKSRVSRGGTMPDSGTIDWIRFEVDIEFSPGITMADIIAKVARPE
jgi:hypothetical protein